MGVFTFLYLVGAVAHMTIFQINQRKGHKFVMSAATFGFCMSRIGTCVLRIAWATRPTNAQIAIAAQIFTNAGILIIYIIVLLLSQRVLRATQPRIGWNKLLSPAFKTLYVFLFCALALVVVFTVFSFYTLDRNILSAAIWIQRGALTYMLVFNLTSMVMLALAILLPPSNERETFGEGSMMSKEIILAVAITLCTFIAGFRAGTTWEVPRPASNPAWYHHKAAFYVINFTFEIIIVYMFAITRFDRRFWIPNGSWRPGDYSRSMDFSAKRSIEKEAA